MTKVEEVAMAICEAEWGEKSWPLVSNHSRNKAIRHARAAIEAMREPTEEMGRLVREKSGFSDSSMYRRFIDAALNEQVAG